MSSAEAGRAEQSWWEEAGAGLQEFGVTSLRIPAQTWSVLPALTMHLPRSKAGLFQKHPGADELGEAVVAGLVLHVGLAPVGARLQTGASAELMSG